jgi:hypothetical protein|tara:strand:- start:8870 stop:15037 length:6168 start_codon:yes stop_codon:yes gene_type:complete
MSLGLIDRNIQTLRHIDGSWSLPEIPDAVRLDLATLPGIGPANIESLLYGMESELEVAQAPIPQQIDVQDVDVAQLDLQQAEQPEQPDPEPMNEFLTRWYGGALMGGQGRPQELDPDAVRLWKEEAVRKGYVELTPEQMADPRWFPEYNVVNRRMASDRLTSGFTGGREGALSIEETANIFDNFAPSGLMRAMTEWDLLMDYDKIAHEWDDWIPKYKRLLYHLQAIPLVPDSGILMLPPGFEAAGRTYTTRKDPSPDSSDGGYASWKTPIAILDAFTGPVDDVALPILNWIVIIGGLAGVGVGIGGLLAGAAVMQGTGLFRFQQSIRTGLQMHRMGPVGRAFITDQPFTAVPGLRGAQYGAQGVQGATRLTNFGRPSGLGSWMTGAMSKSTRFGGRMAAPAQSVGRGMQAWRNTRAIQAARLMNQQLVWRPGLMARGELATGHGGDMPGEGGWSLNEVGIVQDLRQQYGYFMNPDGTINKTNFLGDIAYDILFTPYTIFEPGTFKSVMRGFRLVGHQGARAASAMFPFVRRRFAAFGESGGRATNAMYDAMTDYLRRNPKGDERFPQMSKDFEKTAKETSLDNAFVEHFFAGDKAVWGKAKLWHFMTFGIEHAARQAARLMGVEPHEWSPLYKAIENKLYAQIHPLDPHDAMEYIAHVSRDATKTTVTGARSDADAVAIMRRQLLEQTLESPQTTGLRGTSVGKGYVRLVEEMDPESGWTYWRKLRQGETPAGGARITDVNIEELAAGRGTSLDEARRFLDDPLEEGVQGLVLPPGFEGAHRTFTWTELTTGKARRWDPAKIKMFWDPEVISEGKKYRGIVHNHNDARDATIMEVVNNLETGSPALTEAMQGRIPQVSGLPTQAPRVQGAFGDLPAVMEGLTDDVLERLTNWSAFEQASTELHDAVARGGLADAFYEKALSDSGRRLNLFPFAKDHATGRRTPLPYGGHLLGYAVDNIDYNYVTWINKGMYKPLVRSIDPGWGRVTLARLGSVVKQEAIEFAAQVTYRVKLLKGAQKLRNQPYWDDLVTEAGRFIQSTPIESVKQGTIREWLDDLIKRGMLKTTLPTGIHEEATARIRRLVEYAMRNGKNLDDLEATLIDELGEWALRPEWVNRFGLDPVLVDGGGDLVKVARKRALELQKASARIAAKIDPESLPAYLVKHLEDQGYMAVHGVEFADPRRLGKLIPELDMDTQFINNKLTLGLSRQNPYWLASLRMRTAKSALAGHLAEAARRVGKLSPAEYSEGGIKGTRAEVPGRTKAAEGIRAEFHSGDPNSEALKDLIGFLHNVMRDMNKANMDLLDEMGYGYRMANPMEGVTTKLKLSRTPYSVPDLSILPYNKVREALVGKMVEGVWTGGHYSEDEFRAIWNALKASRRLEKGSSVRGLAHLEDYLRSKNTATSVLTILSRHEAGRFLTPGKFRHGTVTRGTPFVGGMLGSAGASMDTVDRHPEDSEWGSRLRKGVAGTIGFLTGRAAANVALRGGLRARPVINQVADLDVLREKGLLGIWKPGGPAWRNPNDVFNYTDWQRYAHLSDFAANMRDYFRFSLNPVFDISRYVEGMVLSQVVGADVARGLKLNQGPKSFQRMMARRIRKANPGMDAKSAQAAAQKEWMHIRSAFMDIAQGRGDFQWENIENMSQWFTSVGIMGFSPQNWMASTFGQLMEAGIDAEKAYEISRKTYTYGMTGRSAVEQSVNFVWFPFSFMKKTVGHFAEWMGNDLSRGVLLHDMVKAYELVDERYDLNDRWREYLPILEKIRRINLFGYGLSPGEFGGMNAPLIRGIWHNPVSEMVGGTFRGTAALLAHPWEGAPWDKEQQRAETLDMFKDPIVALLMPQALSAPPDADEGWWDDVQTLIKRVFPLLSDFRHLLEDTMQQMQVIGRIPMEQSSMHDEAQIQNAWEEMSTWRAEIVDALTAQGVSWEQFNKRTYTYQGKTMLGSEFVDAKEVELLQKYPAWAASQSGGSNQRMRDLELQVRVANATIPGDVAAADFDVFEKTMKVWLESQEYHTVNPLFMPPEVHSIMRMRASELVAEYPDFLPIYNRIWSHIYGPVTREVR